MLHSRRTDSVPRTRNKAGFKSSTSPMTIYSKINGHYICHLPAPGLAIYDLDCHRLSWAACSRLFCGIYHLPVFLSYVERCSAPKKCSPCSQVTGPGQTVSLQLSDSHSHKESLVRTHTRQEVRAAEQSPVLQDSAMVKSEGDG